jgi:hypothetical protein
MITSKRKWQTRAIVHGMHTVTVPAVLNSKLNILQVYGKQIPIFSGWGTCICIRRDAARFPQRIEKPFIGFSSARMTPFIRRNTSPESCCRAGVMESMEWRSTPQYFLNRTWKVQKWSSNMSLAVFARNPKERDVLLRMHVAVVGLGTLGRRLGRYVGPGGSGETHSD